MEVIKVSSFFDTREKLRPRLVHVLENLGDVNRTMASRRVGEILTGEQVQAVYRELQPHDTLAKAKADLKAVQESD